MLCCEPRYQEATRTALMMRCRLHKTTGIIQQEIDKYSITSSFFDVAMDGSWRAAGQVPVPWRVDRCCGFSTIRAVLAECIAIQDVTFSTMFEQWLHLAHHTIHVNANRQQQRTCTQLVASLGAVARAVACLLLTEIHGTLYISGFIVP